MICSQRNIVSNAKCRYVAYYDSFGVCIGTDWFDYGDNDKLIYKKEKRVSNEYEQWREYYSNNELKCIRDSDGNIARFNEMGLPIK